MTMTMNTFKIQNEVFKEYKKAWSKSKRLSFNNITLGKFGDNVVVVYRAVAAYIIPNSMFILDMDKILDGVTPLSNPDSFFKKAWDGKVLNRKRIEFTEDGRELMVLSNDDLETYINRDYLKFFDDMEYVQFRGVSSKDPVYVFDTYNGEELIGMILPVRR